MLSKLLLTLAVIIIAVVYLQKRKLAEQRAAAPPKRPNPEHTKTDSSRRFQAWLLVLVIIAVSSLIYAWQWQAGQQELTVLLYRDNGSEPLVYRVPRKQFATRSFTTVDGIQVQVSANERIEVIGL